MTMTGNGNPTPGAGQPQIKFLGQYIKDLSFENPNAPRIMSELKQQPAINVQINVNGRLLANTDYEVEIRIECKAEIPGTTIFALDLLYAGIYRLENIPPDNVNPVVMIECPRLLFPFAREIIATTVMHGGFPSLLLDPIDFVALYQQRMAQASQAAPAQA